MKKQVRTAYDNDPFGAKKVYETWESPYETKK
jgi:hypothetical protein